jgi:hypothetical protein
VSEQGPEVAETWDGNLRLAISDGEMGEMCPVESCGTENEPRGWEGETGHACWGRDCLKRIGGNMNSAVAVAAVAAVAAAVIHAECRSA